MTAPHPQMSDAAQRGPRPLTFLVLLAILSVPFYILGAVTDSMQAGSITLPTSALMFTLPVIVAVILVYRDGGVAGVVRLLRRAVDWSTAPRKYWYLIAVLIAPVITVISYGLARAAGLVGGHVPLALIAIPPLVIGSLIGAEFEELGWTGYATEPLQQRWGMVGTGVALGVYWALWHTTPLVQAGHGAWWIAGWFVGTVAARVVIVWLHNNTGHGVLAAVLLHAGLNVSNALTPDLDHAANSITAGVLMAVLAVGVILYRPVRA